MRLIFDYFYRVISQYINVNCMRSAAAMAYYAIFSLSPLLIIIIAVAGFFFGDEAVTGVLYSDLKEIIGEQAATVLQSLVVSVSNPTQSLFASALSLMIIVGGATGLLTVLQEALDDIWEIKHLSTPTWLIFVKKRGFSIFTVIVIGLIFVCSLLLSTSLNTLYYYADNYLPPWLHLAIFAETGLSFLMHLVMFFVIYKLLPSARIQFKAALFSATIASILFLLGRTLLNWYLTLATVSSSFAAAGAIVILLVWIYYSAQIVLLGAVASKQLFDKQLSKLN